MDCSMLGFPVLHYHQEFAQIHVHWASDVIQPFHPLLPPFPHPSIFPGIRIFSWLFSQFWRFEVQDQGVSRVAFFWDLSFCCRWPTSPCVITWSFLCVCKCPVLFFKGHISDWIRSHPHDLIVVVQTPCDPMHCSMPGYPVFHYLPDFAQIHVHESVMLSNYLIHLSFSC